MFKKLIILMFLPSISLPVFGQSVDTAWVRIYNGEGNRDDHSFALAIDIFGNIYVTGYSYGNGTYGDYSTIKYYPNGDTAWERRYNGPGSGDDWANAIAIDDFGNVYVTGFSYGSETSRDYATIKYYPDGDTAWVRRYNGLGNRDDWAKAIAVDGSGNVYVAGESFDSDYDYTTIKYHPNGDTAWVKRYDGAGSGPDYAYAIAVDDLDNVYVTGSSYGSAGWFDCVTVKYSQFTRGDADHDKAVTITDVVYLVRYLFKRGPQPSPIPQAGDANCDGKVNLADAVYLVAYLFKSGPAPCI